jgi:hypothetical protein
MAVHVPKEEEIQVGALSTDSCGYILWDGKGVTLLNILPTGTTMNYITVF